MNNAIVLQKIIKATEGHDDQLWNIITALRACDGIYHRDLKDYTVARLRGFLGFEGRGFFDSRMHPLARVEQEYRTKLLLDVPSHFIKHWKMAVNAVRVCYGYDLTTEQFIIGPGASE